MNSDHSPKVCQSCGRAIAWRKKWERDWDRVHFCSDACRRRKITGSDTALEQAIQDLLSTHAAGAGICPSQAARRVDPGCWEARMEDARRAARRMAARGVVEITQDGRVVDPSTARGPILVRLRNR